MSAPSNPAAFPCVILAEFEHANGGMSLRDYFAGQAIAGLCAVSDGYGTWTMDPQEAVDTAYKVADLMLERRSKP